MDSAGTAVRPLAATVDARGAADIGRAARLELRFGVRGTQTVLLHAYAEPPFRVARPFVDGRGLHLILTSSAPGVFGGDRLTQSIVVEAGARVRLTSQSALQVHSSNDAGVACVANTFTVGDDATLICEWDPVIPFRAAALRQRLEINLAPTARLFWSDAMMAGREARGERWAFARFDHELAMFRGGALTYLERYVIEPARVPTNGRWFGHNAAYFGSVVSVGDTMTSLDAVQSAMATLTGVVGAVDRIEPDVLLVRLMATSGVAFRAARAIVVSM